MFENIVHWQKNGNIATNTNVESCADPLRGVHEEFSVKENELRAMFLDFVMDKKIIGSVRTGSVRDFVMC